MTTIDNFINDGYILIKHMTEYQYEQIQKSIDDVNAKGTNSGFYKGTEFESILTILDQWCDP
jgi:hypothetical protein